MLSLVGELLVVEPMLGQSLNAAPGLQKSPYLLLATQQDLIQEANQVSQSRACR